MVSGVAMLVSCAPAKWWGWSCMSWSPCKGCNHTLSKMVIVHLWMYGPQIHTNCDAFIPLSTKSTEECFQYFVESMPQRIKAVLRTGGGPTWCEQGVSNKEVAGEYVSMLTDFGGIQHLLFFVQKKKKITQIVQKIMKKKHKSDCFWCFNFYYCRLYQLFSQECKWQ